jgi:broad specificity phosphatase PhoE
MGKVLKKIPASEYDDLVNESATKTAALPADDFDNLLNEAGAGSNPQKKSPDQTSSPEQSVNLPGGGSQDNQTEVPTATNSLITDANQGADADPHVKTVQATNIIANHILKDAQVSPVAEYVNNLKTIPFTQPGSIVHDTTDPHGNPKTTGNYAKYAVEQLKLEKQNELQKLAAGGGPNVDPDYKKEADEISRNYDKQIADMQNAAHHIISLQQINNDVANKKTLPKQASKNAWDAVMQSSADIGNAKTPEELAAAEEKSRAQLAAIHNDTKYDALKLGMEQESLLGNKSADDDLAKLQNGQPIPDDRRVQYQAVGYDAIQLAAKNAKATGNDDLAKEMEDHSSNPQRRLEQDNPKYFGRKYANQIGDYVYNNVDNPLYGTLFSRPELTAEEKEKYGKAAGLNKEQLDLVKPEDIPTASSIYGQAAQGAANAFTFGSGDGIFTGKTPQAQHGFGNPRAIIGEIASGAGTVGGFMAQGGLIGEGLKGAELLGDVAANAKRYQSAQNMIPLALSNYSNAYEQSKQVVGDKPEDEVKRQSYAILNGIISTAIMSIDPATKLASEAIFKTPAGEQFIKATIDKGLDKVAPEEFQTKLQTFLQKLPAQTAETGKHVATQAGIMGANKAAENITSMIYDPEHRHDVMDNVGNAAIGGGISMFIPSLLHGMHAGDNPVNKALVWDIGNKAKEYDNLIDEQRSKGILTDEQATQASNFVGKAEGIIKNQVPATNILTGKELTPAQKQNYAWNLMRNEDLNKKLTTLTAGENPDKSQVKIVQDRLSELANERTEILNNAGLTEKQIKGQSKHETVANIGKEIADQHFKDENKKGVLSDEDQVDNDLIKNYPLQSVNSKIRTLSRLLDETPDSKYYKKELGKAEKYKTRLDAAIKAQPEQETVGGIGKELAAKHFAEVNDKGKLDEDDQEDNDEYKSNPVKAVNDEMGYLEKELNDSPKWVWGKDRLGELVDYKKRLDAAQEREQKNTSKNNDKSKEDVSLNSESITEQQKTSDNEKSNENAKPQNTSDNRNAINEEGRQANGEGNENSTIGQESRQGGQLKEEVSSNPSNLKAGESTESPAIPVSGRKRRKIVADEGEPTTEAPPITQKDEYRAWDQGNTEGKPEAEVKSEIENAPHDEKIGGGESFIEFKDRIKKAWEKTKKTAEDQTLLMTHSSVMNMIEAANQHGWDDNDLLRKAYNDSEHPAVGEKWSYDTDKGQIHVMRHGESEDGAAGLTRTKDTPLTNKGIKEAKEDIAGHLNEEKIAPPEIITDTQPRTTHTAELVQEGLAGDKTKTEPLKINDQTVFYHASDRKREGRLKPGHAPQFGEAVYFGSSKEGVHGEYGEGNTTEAELHLDNPLYTNTPEYKKVEEAAREKYKKDNLIWDADKEEYFDKRRNKFVTENPDLEIGEQVPVKYLNDAAKEAGYDAFIDQQHPTYGDEIAVLDESKIKYPEDASTQSKEPTKGDKIQWDVYGNEDEGEWTVGDKVKTRGGKDAVELHKEYITASADGAIYTKEYADKNGIKYENDPSVKTHIVPLEELTAKKTEDASPQSKEQQQKSLKQGSEPEHARAQQAGSEATPAETKNSDSNIRGEEKETLTPKAQAIADKGIGEYNAAHGGKWQKQEQLQKAAKRNVETAEVKLSKTKEGTQAHTDAQEELAGYKAIADHIEAKPPKRSTKNQSKRGTNPTAQQKERKEILSQTPATVEEWAKQQLLAMSDSRPEDKFEIKSVEKDLATRKKTEERTYVGKFAHEDGKRNIDQWANTIADNPTDWPEGLNLSDPQEIKETIQQLLTDYEKKGDLQKELSDIFSEREEKAKAAEEFWSDQSDAEKDSWDLMPESQSDVKKWLAGEDIEPAANEINNTNLTREEANLINEYFESLKDESGKIDLSKVDVFSDAYTGLRDKLSKEAANLLDMSLYPEKTEAIIKKIKNTQNEKQSESDIAGQPAGGEPAAESQDISPRSAEDDAGKQGETGKPAAGEEDQLSEADQRKQEMTGRLKEIEEDLLKQHAAQKQVAEHRSAANEAQDVEAFNKHNAVWNKKQDRIDKLEEERQEIERQLDKMDRAETIQKAFTKASDSVRKFRRDILGDDPGAINVSIIPGITPESVGRFLDHVADTIDRVGNLYISIDSAIREYLKENPNANAPTLEERQTIEKNLEHLKPKLKSEPILSIENEEYAKDILADILDGKISHSEARDEIREEVPENRDGTPLSDRVADNYKAKILNYIDWHIDRATTSIRNATTRIRREQFGLDEEIPAAKKEFGQTWDEAKQKIENGYDPQYLINELSDKPRPLTDVENAIMLHQQNTKEIQLHSLNDSINEAAVKGDKGAMEEARVAKARVLDELQKIYDINKAVGTENARGLASRRMMVDRKYSLSNMIAEKRATANDGQPLNDEQQAHVEELHKKIKETQEAYDNYVKQAESQIIDLQRKALEGKLKDKKTASTKLRNFAERIRQASKNQAYSSPIPITPHMVADAIDLIADGVEKGEQLIDLVKKAVEKSSKANPGINEQELEKEINKNLIESGVLEPSPERRKAEDMGGLFTGNKLDREAVRLKVEADRAKAQVEIDLKRDKERKLSSMDKVRNAFIKWERASKLSGPLTMGKLAMAGLTRLTTTPLEDIVGGAYSAVLPQLAKGAIGEGGGLNVAETAKAYKYGILRGMKDAGEIMRKDSQGKSQLDVLFGKSGDLPPEMIDFFGQLHSATKAPIKRAIFERQLEKRLRRNMANGVDITDPMVQTSVMMDAYKDANRAIFMQDNAASKWWQNSMQALEKADPNTGKAPYKGWATFAKWMVPFIKVPTNIVGETARHAYGLPVGVGQVLHTVITKNMENLSPDEKDVVMRNLKKGTLGAAAMALGYFNPQNFGGYYQQGQKRDDDDAEAMGTKFYGQKIPAWLTEAPIWQAFQIGATARRVKDRMVSVTKTDPETGEPIKVQEPQGIGEGIWAGLSGVAQGAPLVNLPVRLSQVFGSNKERDYYFDELTKSTVEPALITYLAKATDPADKGSVAGKALAPENRRQTPKTLIDHLKSGLPYYREQLPEKPPKQEKAQPNEPIY